MRWFLLASAVSLVATCGQKGPLYLPDEDTEAVHAEFRLGKTQYGAPSWGSAIELLRMQQLVQVTTPSRNQGS